MSELISEGGEAGEASAEGIPERFVPDEMRGQLVEAEHIARYTWAAGFCEGGRVLDAGCGVGYGAELLSQAGASEVVGVDNSEAAIELARNASDNVSYQVGDVRRLAFDDGAFDLVVCFEVIEHVDEPLLVLDELARVLRPGGMLLVSSPNRDRYVPGNPHHRHEFTRPELQAALDARFASARVISQHVMLASAISWAGAPVFGQAETVRPTEPEPQDEVYLLGMAGAELPPDRGPVVSLGRFAEPRRWLDHIEHQRRHIDEQARRIRELEGREENRRAALRRVAEVEQELARLRALEAVADEQIENARRSQAELAAARAMVDAIVGSKSWQLTAPLRKFADRSRQSG